MRHSIHFQAHEITRITHTTQGIEIGAVMTEDQFVAAFVSYLENSNTTDAQAAQLLDRCQKELTT